MWSFLSGPVNELWLAKMTLLTGVINVLVIVSSVLVLYRQQRNTHRWNQFRMAHELSRELNFGKVQQFRAQLESKIHIYDLNESYATMAKELTLEDHIALDVILNYFENVSLAVENGVADSSVICESLSGVLAAYWRWAQPYWEHSRNQVGPELWRFIDPCLNRWRADEDKANKKLEKATHRLKRKRVSRI